MVMLNRPMNPRLESALTSLGNRAGRTPVAKVIAKAAREMVNAKKEKPRPK